MAKVLDLLEERYGWRITYEDPIYQHESEIQDITLQLRPTGPFEPRTLVPRGGPFDFVYRVPVGLEAPPDPLALVQTLISAYHEGLNPGVFAVVPGGPALHVVPVEFLNRDGQKIPQSSILDTVVSLTAGTRSLYSAVHEILQAVTVASSREVLYASGPNGWTRLKITTPEVVERSARDALVRLFEIAGVRASWRLFYDVRREHYFFNVHQVAQVK